MDGNTMAMQQREQQHARGRSHMLSVEAPFEAPGSQWEGIWGR